jgi:hypothetical protein
VGLTAAYPTIDLRGLVSVISQYVFSNHAGFLHLPTGITKYNQKVEERLFIQIQSSRIEKR